MRFQRGLVLLRARDVVFLGDVLGGHAHVDAVEGIVQRAQHHVDQAGIAHARAPAGRRRQVRRAAHALDAAADGRVGIAQQDGLRGADDGLQAGAAQAVDGQRRRVGRHAAVDGRDAAQVHVTRFSLDHIAEHHVADVVARHLRTGQRLAHDQRAHFRRCHILQAAAKGPDRGTDTAHHYDFTRHDLSPGGLCCTAQYSGTPEKSNDRTFTYSTARFRLRPTDRARRHR
ncbi:hypothetical protein D3C72_1693910 [compost metagenome]